jgi:hypothetical protein
MATGKDAPLVAPGGHAIVQPVRRPPLARETKLPLIVLPGSTFGMYPSGPSRPRC